MINFSITLLHGFIICLPFSIFALISFWCWPRLWLHSLPPDIAEMAGPKTSAEIKQTKWLLIPVLLILPGLSVLSTLYVNSTIQESLTILGVFTHIYAIWVIVHLWDLIVIDYGHILFINPERPPIANTEGAKGYRDYGFHFRAFLKASLMSLLFVIPCAVIFGLFL